MQRQPSRANHVILVRNSTFDKRRIPRSETQQTAKETTADYLLTK